MNDIIYELADESLTETWLKYLEATLKSMKTARETGKPVIIAVQIERDKQGDRK